MSSLPVLMVVASEDDGGMARVAFLLAKHLRAFDIAVRAVVHREAPFTQWLRKAGIGFDVVPELVETPTRPRPDGRVGIGAVLRNLGGLPAAARRVREIARRHGSQVLYSHNTWSHFVCALAAPRTTHPARTKHDAPGTAHRAPSTQHDAPRTRLRSPGETASFGEAGPPVCVWHIHNDHGRPLTRLIDRAAIRYGDVAAVIAVSKSIGRPFEGLRASLTVVHNAIDRPACEPQTRLLRSRLGLDDRAVVVAYAGRLVAHKGIHVLVSAARDAVFQVPNLHVVILGGTPRHASNDVLRDLRAQVASSGLERRIHLPGYVDDVQQWMADADVAVVPSTCADGCPLAAIEALCAGVPVIGSAIGGLPEIVDDGVSGLLVPPADAAALADAIVSLARQPGRRRQLAAGAREQARDRFDAARMTARVAAVLRTAARPR